MAEEEGLSDWFIETKKKNDIFVSSSIKWTNEYSKKCKVFLLFLKRILIISPFSLFSESIPTSPILKVYLFQHPKLEAYPFHHTSHSNNVTSSLIYKIFYEAKANMVFLWRDPKEDGETLN